MKSPEIGHAKRDHAAGQRDDSGAVTTPRIPSSGWAETSAGTAAPTARAISIGDGELLRSKPPYFSGYRLVRTVAITRVRTQFGGKGAIVQPNLNGDALYHLREIAGRVVGR